MQNYTCGLTIYSLTRGCVCAISCNIEPHIRRMHSLGVSLRADRYTTTRPVSPDQADLGVLPRRLGKAASPRLGMGPHVPPWQIRSWYIHSSPGSTLLDGGATPPPPLSETPQKSRALLVWVRGPTTAAAKGGACAFLVYTRSSPYQADLVVGWPCSSPTLCEGRRGEARRGGGRDGPCGAARRPARVPEATASYSNNIIPRKFDSCVVRQRRSGDRNGPRPMYRPHVCPPCRANLCAPEPPDPAIPAAPAARPGLTRPDARTSVDGLQAYMSVIMSVDCLHALHACRWRLTGV